MQIPGQLAQSRFLGDRLKVGTRRQTFKGTPAAIPVLGQTRLQSPASGPAPGSSRPPAPYAPPAGNNPPVTAHPHCCNCLSGYGRRVRTLQPRSEEHTSELQSRPHLVCRLLLEKKKTRDATSP